MLKETYTELLTKYTVNKTVIKELWTEIEEKYSSQKRHYHTLSHLENILIQLNEVKKEIQDWDTILFTLYYHDIIYNAIKTNNEEESSKLAEKRMRQIIVSADTIELCKEQILTTQSHTKSTNQDTNYFTDADLSILGQEWSKYTQYYQKVRKEYAVYPDLVYNIGRKKVLNKFLKMGRIFKTDYFFKKFNKKATKNVQKEIDLL